MRLALLLAPLLACAQPAWVPQKSSTGAGLRGLSVRNSREVWASGTGGTYLHTADGGATWNAAQVPGAESLDFRDIEASGARTVILLASGTGEKSRIFRTDDGGAHWALRYTNPAPAGFFDAISFWKGGRGIALGDPIGGHFAILLTGDGERWSPLAGPEALPGEGAFAASGTCLIATGARDAWFGTGGARVLHSKDNGRTWTVAQTPVRHDGPGAGIFSLVFSDARHGVAVGGDYTKPESAEHNIAVTGDGGRTWAEPEGTHPAGFRSAVAWVAPRKAWIAVGTSGSDVSYDGGQSWTRFDTAAYNAVAFAADGTGWAVGPKGAVARLEWRGR